MKDFNMENFLGKLKEESKVYKNYNFIMEKSEKDGYLKIFFDSLKYVFKNEMSFTITELKKMQKTDKKIKIKKMLETNLYIFKENIKLILNNCVEQVWGFCMKNEYLDNLIFEEKNKNQLLLITELDEENEITEKSGFEKSEKIINESINTSENNSEEENGFKKEFRKSFKKKRKRNYMDYKNLKGFKSLEELNGFSSLEEIKFNKIKKFNKYDKVKKNDKIDGIDILKTQHSNLEIKGNKNNNKLDDKKTSIKKSKRNKNLELKKILFFNSKKRKRKNIVKNKSFSSNKNNDYVKKKFSFKMNQKEISNKSEVLQKNNILNDKKKKLNPKSLRNLKIRKSDLRKRLSNGQTLYKTSFDKKIKRK